MAKKQIQNYKFFPGVVPPAFGQYTDAVALLTANKNFIIEEMSQYIKNQIALNADNALSPYFNYVYGPTRETKCRRDTGYVLDAFIYDLTYGGNSLTYAVASNYYIDGVVQVVSTDVEVDTHTYLKSLIITNILTNTLATPLNLEDVSQVILPTAGGLQSIAEITTLADFLIDTIDTGLSALPDPVAPSSQNNTLLLNAVTLIEANKRFIQEEAIAFIQFNSANNISPYVNYTYNVEKCRRDISYILEGYISDFKRGGNRQTIFNAEKYWENGVAQVDGDRQPEIVAHTFIRDLIENFILTNTVFSNRQILVSQVIDFEANVEVFAATRVKELSNIILEVIENGLAAVPTKISNRGYIKMPGYFKIKDLLLITNASRNIIMYNFADDRLAAEITYTETLDTSFPGALYGVDKITTVTFDIDTSNMMVTDNIQIFVEGKEQIVRMNSIATDAMERQRVGIPQSMLDADFEYGLQPTKWQAIGLMRNYPSIYEIPGTEIPVVNVVTNASAPTGIGASQITVTTIGNHGLLPGDPITIKALSNSVQGFSRGEGSFLVSTVPTTSTFTFFAKAKVGTTDGEILASTYTQLRKGGYYTGSAVGLPSFNVLSNGSSGTITTSLITPIGSTSIGFSSAPPPIGAPLTGTGVVGGSQITAVTGAGGTAASTTLLSNATTGDNTLTVTSTTGIGPGLIFDRGDGVAVRVTDVTGNVVTLSGGITTNIRGTTQTFAGLSGSTSGNGVGAVFSVSRTPTYAVTTSTPGSGYVANDTILIAGTALGGAAPANNATITVTSATPVDSVATLNAASLAGGTGYSNSSAVITTSSGSGTGLTVDITQTSGIIDTVAINSPGQGYAIGETITIGAAGRIAASTNIVAGTGYSTAAGLVTTSSGGGTGCIVDIVDDGSGGIASVTIVNSGSGYAATDVVTVVQDGAAGGTFEVQSLFTQATIQVATITAGGVIQTVSISGTAVTAPSRNFISAITISEPTTAQILSDNTGINFSAIATIEVTFASAHGFIPGNTITTSITSSGTNAQLAAGPFFVEQVPTPTTLRYTARGAGLVDNTLVGNLFGRPDSFFIHRPFDGGVQLGTAGPAHGATAIRMSKKYIRYQSGKGVMYNTGALFAPSYDIRTIISNGTAVGSTITIICDDTDHGCQVGGVIVISGVATSGYNGTYTVSSIGNERQLSFIATQRLGSTSPVLGSPCQMSIKNWHGSTVRSGIFDDQNGMFWQYDGQRMAVVRRSSTFQIAGTISINVNSNIVTGANTRFTQQLATGDRIVIRGMTHVVTQLTNDTLMTVSPDYRGVTNVSSVKITKVQDLIVPQEDWNLDTCNGAGPSGYNLDVTKMQMIGIQHTWYGAGFIDFMLRGSDGNYLFVHRFRNSNVNSEAYMRTGNQPVRYEVINEGARGRLNAAMTSNQTTIPMSAEDLYWFPNSGTVYIDNELISFTGNNGSALTGCTRAANLTQFVSGSTRTFSAGVATLHTERTGVVLISNTITPIISHWGSAFMIDGQFDSDRGYIFNYAATAISATLEKNTAFLIRLAPSVSNAVIGDLGDRELLNRAQLLLSSIAISSDTVAGGGAIVVEGVLNPINYPINPANITWTGLSSQAAGGQPSFAQIAAGGSVTWSGDVRQTTATVQGAFTTTLTAPSFTPVTNALTAISFNTTTTPVTAASFGQTITALGQANGQPYGNNSYVRAVDTTRSDVLISNTQFDSLATPLAVNDTITGTGVNSTIQSITRGYLGGTFTRIVLNNLPSISSAPGAGQNVTLQVNGTYGRALSASRNDFLITQSSFAALTSTIGNTDGLSATTFLVGGQTISSVTPNFITIAGVSYARIIMSGNASANSNLAASNGAQNVAVTITIRASQTYNTAISASRNDFLITQTQFAGSTIAATDVLTAITFLTGGQTISSVTPNFVTVAGTAYARVIMSANGSTTSTAGAGNNISVTSTSAVTATYGRAFSTSRSDFLVTDSSIAGSGIVVSDVLSIAPGNSVTLASVAITGTAGQFSCTSTTLSVGQRVTITGTFGGTGSISGYSSGTQYFIVATNGSTTFTLSTTEGGGGVTTTAGTPTGLTYTLTTFINAGQTITSIIPSFVNIGGTNYTRVIMSAPANASSATGSGNNITVTVTAAGTAASYVNRNFLFFTSASWLSSGAVVGTRIATSVTSFPAGTAVNTVETRTYGATTIYRVTFSQSANTTINASSTITWQFGALYALPGEQVFSFIANPGESGELSLESLKELTATAIGGRGAFPNGPDVLAINVYKVSGSPTNTSVILRWGEAQA
jgi:hypothetical protein